MRKSRNNLTFIGCLYMPGHNYKCFPETLHWILIKNTMREVQFLCPIQSSGNRCRKVEGICPVSDNQEMAELVFEPRSLVFRIMETFTIIHSGLFQIEASGINNLLSCNDIESGWILQIGSLGQSKLVHYCNNSLLGQPNLSERTPPHLCLCVLE